MKGEEGETGEERQGKREGGEDVEGGRCRGGEREGEGREEDVGTLQRAHNALFIHLSLYPMKT